MKRRYKTITWIVAATGILVVAVCILVPYVVMKDILDRRVTFSQVYQPGAFGLDADTLFVDTEDGLKISAFEVKADRPKAIVLCLSGIHNPSVTVYYGHAKLLRENGYASILIDMRAHGLSEGDKIGAGYKEYKDVDAVVDYIKGKKAYDQVPIVVMGLSLGAATAINAAGHNPAIDGLISLSAFSSWEDAFRDNMAMVAPSFVCALISPFVDVVSFIKFGKSSFVKPVSSIARLGNRPALLIHSKEDSQVPYGNFERLLEHAPAGVRTMTIEGDNHFILDDFTHPENDRKYCDVLLNFLRCF